MRAVKWLRRLRGYATGGAVSQRVRAEGEVPCFMSEGREVTDHDHTWHITWPGVGGVVSVQFTDKAGTDWTVLICADEARRLAALLNRAADGSAG